MSKTIRRWLQCETYARIRLVVSRPGYAHAHRLEPHFQNKERSMVREGGRESKGGEGGKSDFSDFITPAEITRVVSVLSHALSRHRKGEEIPLTRCVISIYTEAGSRTLSTRDGYYHQ